MEASTPSAEQLEHRTGACAAAGAVPAADPALRQSIELLFFAYRDFTGDADTVLAGYGFASGSPPRRLFHRSTAGRDGG